MNEASFNQTDKLLFSGLIDISSCSLALSLSFRVATKAADGLISGLA